VVNHNINKTTVILQRLRNKLYNLY